MPAHLSYISYKDSLELRPCISTNLAKEVDQAIANPKMIPDRAVAVVGNLIHSIKLIASKAIPSIPISGNVEFDDSWGALNKYGDKMVSSNNLYEAETGWGTHNNFLSQSYQSNSALLQQHGHESL